MLVTAIIPALRVDAALDLTLASLAAQELPEGVELEVVVAVATSGNSSSAIDGARVRLVENPGGSIPAGLNRAIAAAKGEHILRVDARCSIPPHYVASVLGWLKDPGVGSVGGAALVMDHGFIGVLYGTAFNSPLLGPSDYRYSRRTRDTDSPYLGAWRRDVLDEVGLFDERLLRNQDNEHAAWVGASGRRVVYDADLVVGYTAGRSLRAAIRHHYGFGLWRSRQRAMGQSSVTSRQIGVITGAASIVIAGAVLLVVPATRTAAIALAATAYVGAGLVAGVTAARLRSARPDLELTRVHPLAVLVAPSLAAVINGAWAWGLLRGRRASL